MPIAFRLLYKTLVAGLECSSPIWTVILWNGIFRCHYGEVQYGLDHRREQMLLWTRNGNRERPALGILWHSSLLWITSVHKWLKSGKISKNPIFFIWNMSQNVPFKITMRCFDLSSKIKTKFCLQLCKNGKESVIGMNQWVFFTVRQHKWCNRKQFW